MSLLAFTGTGPVSVGLRIAAPVSQRQPPAEPQRAGQIAQAGDFVVAGEPARHVQVHQGRAAPPGGVRPLAARHPGREPDLAVRLVQGPVEAQFAQHAGYPQDEQGLGFLGAQAPEREAVAVHEPASAPGPGLGYDGHPGRGQRLEVAVYGPDRHLELGRQGPGRRGAPRLQQQDQGQQPVGAHLIKIRARLLT